MEGQYRRRANVHTFKWGLCPSIQVPVYEKPQAAGTQAMSRRARAGWRCIADVCIIANEGAFLRIYARIAAGEYIFFTQRLVKYYLPVYLCRRIHAYVMAEGGSFTGYWGSLATSTLKNIAMFRGLSLNSFPTTDPWRPSPV